ncbi:MAG: Penicillin-binding protein 1A [Syntrophorhabdus sp. PtaU1.Bin058]|nr:MAG: Penicillin-binding protein 1A [Syntrophorhabdus sp. PtaU1.Bin058]
MVRKRHSNILKKRRPLYLIALVALSCLILSVGLVAYIMNDIPSVAVMKHLENRPISNVYDNNDQIVYLIVPDNRIFVTYNKIPKYVKDAFLAAEDADFFKHGAVDPLSIVRALWKNILYGKVVQGGSTITQQVVKSLMLSPEKNITRKVKEAILSYRLENSLTKKEILNLYLNNIYMGHGVYGVEAASQVYFGRHVWEISRAEAALLAGIVQAPSRYTPKRHPGNARIRQEYVIDQMAEKGFINAKTKKDMLKERIAVREDDGVFSDSYFKDFIFRYVEEKYGKGAFSRKGLKIYATVDTQLQKLGEEAVRKGLNLYEQRKGDYVVAYHLEKRKWGDFIKAEDKDIKLSGLRAGKIYDLLISERMKSGYLIQAGKEKGILQTEGFPFKPGDVIKGIYSGADRKKNHLFQPVRSLKVEGALLCMDVQTGYVQAMVGGRDFERSPYNRAVSAKVQSGSAFKPFIYVTALKKGYDLDTLISDEPKEYHFGAGRTWTPKNYDNKYEGQITIRDAVAYSKNAATVRLLEDIGVGAVKETIRDLGINVEIEDNLSIALGTSNLTLLDLVKGFAVFANGGYRVKPLFVKRIVDNAGNVLEEDPVEKDRVLTEEIASKMNILLKGPTEYGTAKGASKLGYPVAGKTGTTSNYYDALFVGYSPHIVTGVWVGFDARTSLGKGESGARVCLPIWMSFMGSALRRYPPDDFAEVGMTGIDTFPYH